MEILAKYIKETKANLDHAEPIIINEILIVLIQLIKDYAKHSKKISIQV
jgi:hypothetical protein